MVNETFAREAFPDGVGRRVVVDETDVHIVGVVEDVRQSDLHSHAELYVPFGGRPRRRMHMVVRI